MLEKAKIPEPGASPLPKGQMMTQGLSKVDAHQRIQKLLKGPTYKNEHNFVKQ